MIDKKSDREVYLIEDVKTGSVGDEILGMELHDLMLRLQQVTQQRDEPTPKTRLWTVLLQMDARHPLIGLV